MAAEDCVDLEFIVCRFICEQKIFFNDLETCSSFRDKLRNFILQHRKVFLDAKKVLKFFLCKLLGDHHKG